MLSRQLHKNAPWLKLHDFDSTTPLWSDHILIFDVQGRKTASRNRKVTWKNQDLKPNLKTIKKYSMFIFFRYRISFIESDSKYIILSNHKPPPSTSRLQSGPGGNMMQSHWNVWKRCKVAPNCDDWGVVWLMTCTCNLYICVSCVNFSKRKGIQAERRLKGSFVCLKLCRSRSLAPH